ncbi:MAG: cell division protein FtsK [Flavobacteriaceae bacterium]|nr:cell division protein FtsK [Flavobacteriaceae bacterium]
MTENNPDLEISNFSEDAINVNRSREIIFGSFLFILGTLLFISFCSYFYNWQTDQSTLDSLNDRQIQSENLLNKIGAWVSHLFIFDLFGLVSFIFTFLLCYTGVSLFFNKLKKSLLKTWSWGISYILWGTVFFGFFYSESYPLLSGTVGFEINDIAKSYIGPIGLISFLVFSGICIIVLHWKFTPEKIMGLFRKENSKKSQFSVEDSQETTELIDKNESIEVKNTLIDDNTNYQKNDAPGEFKRKDEVNMEVKSGVTEETLADNQAKKLLKEQGPLDPKRELSKYIFPNLNLLNEYGEGTITVDQEELGRNKDKILETLNNYKIGIASIKATVGPTVTLYEIVPEAGIRISKIKNLEDDIALSLSALGIRIIAPIPGKGTIGIEVPNQNSSIVSMRSVISSTKFQKAEMELPIALGKNISNETFVVDLTKMPHLLMAGATGQGKSVGLNAILTSLLYKKHPAEVKFVLIDPKKVELTIYNKIERHYLAKLPDAEESIITDSKKIIKTLNSLCAEMDNRYELLKLAMCRNIKEYNKKFCERRLLPTEGHDYLPYIVLVIDEFADLFMTAGKEVETPIARLAQLARAVGIHLVIATQRPSVNVITGLIKANFPARIAFRVTSKIDSRTILDSGGADQLIGRGDMLYTVGNDLVRIQCAFVDTPEVDKITDFIGGQKAYPQAYLLPEYIGEETSSIDIDDSERDELFREAAEIIVTSQQGSASLLQRKLKLGYNRAGRIIDQMEAAGIVGPFEGSKARQVLISDLNSLDQFLKNQDE